MQSNPLAADMDHILDHTRDLWGSFQGERLFITGGTGFFGCWILESFTWAVDRLGLNSQVVVLTRDPQAFEQKAPHLANHPAVHLLRGDICSFDFPDGHFTHLIHGATESGQKRHDKNPSQMLFTIVKGTQRVLEMAGFCGAENFLFTSSGAVYGQQPTEISHIDEDFKGGPDVLKPDSAYGEGKRIAELLCTLHAMDYPTKLKIARGFAFVGPYLPLDVHFAIGNFIRDGMLGSAIQVQGDGSPYRSYLYSADLTVWLWTILIKGIPLRPYNVGSEEALSISDLAKTVAEAFEPRPAINIAQSPKIGVNPPRYVPSVKRASGELGLMQHINLNLAIRKTIAWHQRS
jgi:nucleoside-diphosphate-sugar epimerase